MLKPGAVHADWHPVLEEAMLSAPMRSLKAFLLQRHGAGAEIFPPARQMLSAFRETPFEQVRAVILGQDPYCGRGQAHGLSFSVNPGVRVPPSLRNIFIELKSDLGLKPPDHGCLLPWARSGVLLLNTVLSVERGSPGSHAGKGWEVLTEAALDALGGRSRLVFLLWGAHAKKCGQFLDRGRHLVLEAAHPSPHSVNHGFFGCKHFSACNNWLQQQGIEPIDWQLPPKAQLSMTEPA